MSALNPIRVLIVDDHPLLRNGISAALSVAGGLEVVGEAADGVEAVSLSLMTRPDVILIDLLMPCMDGIAAIREIRRSCSRSAIMVLTNSAEENHVQAAFEAGAMSYLSKNISMDEMVNAVRAAASGRSVLSDEAKQSLIHTMQRQGTTHYGLSERETEVLNLMAQGLRNEDIGSHLTICTSTVKKHVRNILEKLHVHNRTEAVAFAVQHDLVKNLSQQAPA